MTSNHISFFDLDITDQGHTSRSKITDMEEAAFSETFLFCLFVCCIFFYLSCITKGNIFLNLRIFCVQNKFYVLYCSVVNTEKGRGWIVEELIVSSSTCVFIQTLSLCFFRPATVKPPEKDTIIERK